MGNLTPAELAAIIAANPDIHLDDPDDLKALRSPRAPAQTESQMQMAVIAEAERRAVADARWSYIYHPANGEWRHKATAGRLKAMGVKAGVLDLHLDIACRGYHGFRCELKVSPNKLTASQKKWVKFLQEQGYFTATVWNDPMAVIELIAWYLGED